MADIQQNSQPRNRVTVGCKLPHGLVTQLYAISDGEDGKPVMRKKGSPVKFNGANSSTIVGGFGLTEIDADYWEAWSKQNVNFPALKAGLIFAQSVRNKATDNALDNAKAKTGFEPIDPNRPMRGIEPVPERDLRASAAMS